VNMHDERWTLAITETGDVRLRDLKTGDSPSFTGCRALYDALGVLADWREGAQQKSNYGAQGDPDHCGHFGCRGYAECQNEAAPHNADHHPMSNCGPLTLMLNDGDQCPTCGTVVHRDADDVVPVCYCDGAGRHVHGSNCPPLAVSEDEAQRSEVPEPHNADHGTPKVNVGGHAYRGDGRSGCDAILGAGFRCGIGRAFHPDADHRAAERCVTPGHVHVSADTISTENDCTITPRTVVSNTDHADGEAARESDCICPSEQAADQSPENCAITGCPVHDPEPGTP
jgi:hypothetical protein